MPSAGHTRRLTPDQVRAFRDEGWLCPLPAFASVEVPRLRALFDRLRALLPPDASTQQMDWWHVFDRELYDLCASPAILDRVQSLLGGDFYLWGTQFFAKDPGDGRVTPWHQDAFYWPLRPHRSVTVWLAFADSDLDNGAMEVIPRSHLLGHMQHEPLQDDRAVLPQQLAEGRVDLRHRVALELLPGQMSLHDDRIVHGSRANRSSRMRCGLTIRYSAGEVECDTSVWPQVQAFWMRGNDRWQHNPLGAPPRGPMSELQQATTTHIES